MLSSYFICAQLTVDSGLATSPENNRQLCIPKCKLWYPDALLIASETVFGNSQSRYDGICMNIEDIYHLPRGQLADCIFTFAFIKQPHSLHWLVILIRLGQTSQIANLVSEKSFVTYLVLGFKKSSGVTPPFFSLYCSHRDLTLIKQHFPYHQFFFQHHRLFP